MKLYSAPMNMLSNHVYRHLLLKNGADYAFSEMIQLRFLDKETEKGKLKVMDGDLMRTIVQVALSDVNEFNDFFDKVPEVPEINLNVDCPHSSMVLHKVCAGLLHHEEHLERLLKEFSSKVVDAGFLPSVKIRLGTDADTIRIKEYFRMMSGSGIKKTYVHARPLRYPYGNPALHQHLEGLKQEFKDMEVVINGDVDCYDSYLKLVENVENDGVMIGRASLFNPLVFRQIKDEIKVGSKSYHPVRNDPNLVIDGESVLMLDEKKKIIREFLDLCEEHELRLQIVKQNLSYLIKGFTGAPKMMKCINVADSIYSINEIFNKL